MDMKTFMDGLDAERKVVFKYEMRHIFDQMKLQKSIICGLSVGLGIVTTLLVTTVVKNKQNTKKSKGEESE